MKKFDYRALVFITALLPLASFADSQKQVNISLDEPARAFVVKEMQGFLFALQQITAALANDDMEMVAKAVKPVGKQLMRKVPKSLKPNLPKGFRMLGSSVHNDFDLIALDAVDIGDSQHTLSQLSEILTKCIACHATYQITVVENK